jgi:DNA-binding transcriptional ArsR family regulator
MVERAESLTAIFACLSDPTRRDILRRVAKRGLAIGEIAETYPMSFAAVAKHIEVLARAELVRKQRQGKHQLISINAGPLGSASRYLERYRELWEQRLDRLGNHLKTSNEGNNDGTN